jgi:hypothetical protein
MATTFANTTAAPQPNPYQHNYKKSAQYTEYSGMGSGANTPTHTSPPSPRTVANFPAHSQHAPPIRPLKTPIYVPAALRRTEKPGRQSPPKIDSANHTPTGSFNASGSTSQVAGDVTPISPISRIATEDWNSIYDNAPLSPVAGPITKNHWQVCFFPLHFPCLPRHYCQYSAERFRSPRAFPLAFLLLRTIFAVGPLALQWADHSPRSCCIFA